MILDCIPSSLGTQHGDFYDGVPRLSLRHVSIWPNSKPNLVVAYTARDIRKLVSEMTRLIVWMWKISDEVSIPDNIQFISGTALLLPSWRNYIGVDMESFDGSWWLTQLVEDEESWKKFLMPKNFTKATGYRRLINDTNLDINLLPNDLKARGQFLWNLGMPRVLRISPKWLIAINPTK